MKSIKITKESYNKTSGRKTLILVIAIMALVIFLTIYTVFTVFRKSTVVTNSSYFDGAAETDSTQTPIIPK